nr:hypothetical protein [Tanacetum cinerariifolium]
MKHLIVELPMLTAAMEKEELIVYLAAAKETVSAVLMTEKEAKQMPIYFVSRALRGPELNHISMEKLVLALVHASKCLKRSPCTDVSKVGLILTNPEGIEFTYALRFRFDATNNEAKYEALIAGLRISEQMGVKNLQANVDSRLVANQVNGTYIAKEVDMIRYLEKVKALMGSLKAFSIKQIPRSENKKADALSKIASTSFAHLSKQVMVEVLKEKSIGEIEILTVVEEEGDTWMTPLFKYLVKGTLRANVKKGKAIRRKSWRFDARMLIKACQDCQVHKPVPKNPQQKLTSLTSLWPFYKWGIDIAEPFPEGPGKVKFLIVAMDYLTKWIEAKLVATITGNQIKKFVWETFSAERAIRSLGDRIKARLDAKSKNWIEELPRVLWAHRTMIKSSNEDTPFSLTYVTKAVILAEIGMPTLRTVEVDLVGNNEALEINLDLLK